MKEDDAKVEMKIGAVEGKGGGKASEKEDEEEKKGRKFGVRWKSPIQLHRARALGVQHVSGVNLI